MSVKMKDFNCLSDKVQFQHKQVQKFEALSMQAADAQSEFAEKCCAIAVVAGAALLLIATGLAPFFIGAVGLPVGLGYLTYCTVAGIYYDYKYSQQDLDEKSLIFRKESYAAPFLMVLGGAFTFPIYVVWTGKKRIEASLVQARADAQATTEKWLSQVADKEQIIRDFREEAKQSSDQIEGRFNAKLADTRAFIDSRSS